MYTLVVIIVCAMVVHYWDINPNQDHLVLPETTVVNNYHFYRDNSSQKDNGMNTEMVCYGTVNSTQLDCYLDSPIPGPEEKQ